MNPKTKLSSNISNANIYVYWVSYLQLHYKTYHKAQYNYAAMHHMRQKFQYLYLFLLRAKKGREGMARIHGATTRPVVWPDGLSRV